MADSISNGSESEEVWPPFLFDCFVKNWATCKNLLGKWFTAPPGKKLPVRLCSSVNFTWRFSGDVAGIEFDFKATNAATIEKNGKILFLNTFRKTVYVHQSFTGRVTGSRSGNSSSGQVIFNLSGITLNDTDTYGCQLYANNVRDSGQFDYSRLIVEGDVHFFHTYIFEFELQFCGGRIFQ